MRTKNKIRAGLRACGLERAALAVLPAAKRGVWCMRAACRADLRMTRRYLAAAPSRNLHLGCGQHVLPGWLNTDLYPLDGGVLHVDAARRFPFRPATFDRIYSEHLIEHLTYPQGRMMLEECFRVLKPGGRLAISDVVAIRTIPTAIQQDYEKHSGCVAGALQVRKLERILRATGFDSGAVKVKEQSKEFIKDWFPGSGIEQFVRSADVQGVKPGRQGR